MNLKNKPRSWVTPFADSAATVSWLGKFWVLFKAANDQGIVVVYRKRLTVTIPWAWDIDCVVSFNCLRGRQVSPHDIDDAVDLPGQISCFDCSLLYRLLAFDCLPSRQTACARPDRHLQKDPPRSNRWVPVFLQDSLNYTHSKRQSSYRNAILHSFSIFTIDTAPKVTFLQDSGSSSGAIEVSALSRNCRQIDSYHQTRSIYVTLNNGQSLDTKLPGSRLPLGVSFGGWQLANDHRRCRNRTRRNTAVHRLCGVLL
jgi:hypothetical protein